MNQYQEYIHKSRYARWLPEQGRREDWRETVGRYVGYWVDKGYLGDNEKTILHAMIEDQEIMPSMRAKCCKLVTFLP